MSSLKLTVYDSSTSAALVLAVRTTMSVGQLKVSRLFLLVALPSLNVSWPWMKNTKGLDSPRTPAATGRVNTNTDLLWQSPSGQRRDRERVCAHGTCLVWSP